MSADGGAARSYPNVIRAILETPWAILPHKLEQITELIALRASGHRLTDEEIAARLSDSPLRQPASAPATIAVLPLYGSLVPRADMFTRFSGGTSMEDFGHAFSAAVANQQIDAILIDVDSPGGTVAGTPELGELIRSARGAKPIVAIANKMACSGAYWIASQADEIVASPSATLGSIGVFAAHGSFARALDKEGVDVTVIKAGRFKAETNPWEPLSDDARQHMQETIDEAYEKFVLAVARGRGVSVEKVMADYGEGRTVSADMALAAGMVDRIATFEETVERLLAVERTHDGATFVYDGTAITPTSSGVGHEIVVNLTGDAAKLKAAFAKPKSFSDEATAARDAVDALVTRTRSLAEFRDRGRLTAAKRDQLAAVLASLDEAYTAVDALLAESDKHAAALEREIAHFELNRNLN